MIGLIPYLFRTNHDWSKTVAMSEQPVAKTKPVDIIVHRIDKLRVQDGGNEGASTSSGSNREDIDLFLRASWLESEGKTSDGIYSNSFLLTCSRCSNQVVQTGVSTKSRC